MKIIISLLTITLSLCAHANQPNFVFIMVDDLRPELGAFGNETVISPNIDKLARQGTRFNNAYANIPVCGASRASIMTGIRPTPARFVDYSAQAAIDMPNATTLPAVLKQQGYQTISYGKIFHHMMDKAEISWSEKPWHPTEMLNPLAKYEFNFRDYQLPENIKVLNNSTFGPSTEMANLPDNAYVDGRIADKTVAKLAQLAKSDQPFFLAVGFVKPHLPFTAPKKYWDMYDPAQFSLAKQQQLPIGAPQQAYHQFGELRSYTDIPANPAEISDEKARHLIHGYHASVSYADAQVGKVLEQLEKLNLTKNTIVVLLGDHGWSLGEHGLWCKHSTFDVATKTPLIIKSPFHKPNQQVNALVEFVDILPTITDLANVATPKQAAGESMESLLDNPELEGKSAVFPRWLKSEVIRTKQYSLTQWFDKKGKLTTQMLYDHESDPLESKNIANQPAYKPVLKDLSEQLKAHIANRK